ncbi:MAG: hypothetical protein J0M00_17565 [Burkholderiales bacterium]|nr:hypothetical protein [Burkholderiales bacterium]
MVKIQIDGLAAARATVEGFSDRRFAAAVATALTRTGKPVQEAWRLQLGEKLDRPTPLTLGAPMRTDATAEKLVVEVALREQVRAGATPPSEYLATQEQGGDRGLKKFERALIARGTMRAGQRAVPGQYAQLDGYGNVSRGQIVQVLAQLGTAFSPGYAQVISADATRRARNAARTGNTYVAVTAPRGKLQPGIYRKFSGDLLPVFFFVSRTRYPRRTKLMDAARQLATTRFPAELERSLAEHQARVNARRAGR